MAWKWKIIKIEIGKILETTRVLTTRFRLRRRKVTIFLCDAGKAIRNLYADAVGIIAGFLTHFSLDFEKVSENYSCCFGVLWLNVWGIKFLRDPPRSRGCS